MGNAEVATATQRLPYGNKEEPSRRRRGDVHGEGGLMSKAHIHTVRATTQTNLFWLSSTDRGLHLSSCTFAGVVWVTGPTRPKLRTYPTHSTAPGMPLKSNILGLLQGEGALKSKDRQFMNLSDMTRLSLKPFLYHILKMRAAGIFQ